MLPKAHIRNRCFPCSARCRRVSALTGAVLLLASACAFAGDAGSGAASLQIDGVGSAMFKKAVIVPEPANGKRPPDSLCVSLEGGSKSNSDALLTWLKSNSAGGALATRPDGTLTVSQNSGAQKKGVYKLTHITVDDFVEKADRDESHPRVDSVKIKCDTLQQPV